jgi:hypothetical protein
MAIISSVVESVRRNTSLRKYIAVRQESAVTQTQTDIVANTSVVNAIPYEELSKQSVVTVNIVETGPYEDHCKSAMVSIDIVESKDEPPRLKTERKVLDHRPRLNSRELSFKSSPEMGIKVSNVYETGRQSS